MKKLTAVLVTGLVVSSASSARAESKKPEPSSTVVETYVFEDDKLLQSNLAPDTAVIAGEHRKVTILLTRPRAHFVPELVKTIEDL